MNQENIERKPLEVELAVKIESPVENKIPEKNSTESVSDTPSNRNEQDTITVSITKLKHSME